MSEVKALKVKLFADGADLSGMKEMAANPLIQDGEKIVVWPDAVATGKARLPTPVWSKR